MSTLRETSAIGDAVFGEALVGQSGSIPGDTPPVVFYVSADDRVFHVPADDRVFHVPQE